MGQGNQKSLKMFQVIKVIDLETIAVPEDIGESYRFRIEILEDYENRGHFYPRVWRRETFRLSPTFPLKKDSLREYWDEELLIVDITKEWETIRGKTVEDVLEKVVGEIEKTFRKERRE